MIVDQKLKAVIQGLSTQEIMSKLTNIGEIAEVELLEMGPYPGPHVTPERMLEIIRQIKCFLSKDDIDGVVITHGTDTLEETAYMADLLIDLPKPVVFTGAMRNSSELGYDGPANLAAAICTATAENSRHKGVLIVMNNEVNAAAETTKTHTMKLDTFKSLDYGPLGIVDNNQVIYYRSKKRETSYLTDKIVEDVALIKSASGMDDLLIRFCVDNGCKGIVIEAMGRGNIPAEMVSGVRYAIAHHVPVVLVSRCPMGRVLDSYGYPGGGKELRSLGVIMGVNMSGPKARIKLMVVLAAASGFQDIKRQFETEEVF